MNRMINSILRIEGLAAFSIALAAYFHLGFSWVALVLLILVPDVFMLGYLKDNSWGAIVYNIGHTYVTPLVLLALSHQIEFPVGSAFALIWIAHIGIDRALGFGLKRASGFKDTYLRGAQ